MRLSGRGFKQGEEIVGLYGGMVRAYESSGMTPAIWLNVAVPEPNTPDGDIVDDATILLTLKDVRALEKQLRSLRKNHFLGDE